ncbi:hypothetical protein JL193_09925 [Polaribacter batillariae]|uniref:Anti-sigma factor n=1 Tax=Polaribacter batillariae TaxID=2808900 RepID=A0ABX7SQG8_9FLAO|nr:hypothetical protein [Polaribacter batillariae]QTD36472.1 hypothetical protein JL193_09925 [Polaribacter batillariae]
MNIQKSDDLKDKYFTAKTTLEEEKLLFNSKNRTPEIEKWAAYVKKNKAEIPSNLKDSVWNAIRNKEKKKRQKLIRFSGIAASVVLFLSVFIYNYTNKIKYKKNEALLNEALSMFPEENIVKKQQIFYEDNMVIVYLESK